MAQSRYQYGTSPRKLEPDYTRKRTTQRRKLQVVENAPRKQTKISAEQRNRHVRVALTIACVFVVLLAISFRNSQIDKKFNYIQEQKKTLSLLEKENEQLKVSIENSLNLSNIKKIAEEELGMQKLSSKQTIYVTLTKKDYVQSASEKVVIEQEKNWWGKIADKLFDF